MSEDAEELKRKILHESDRYVYRGPLDPLNEGFHYHYCRICDEDHECLEDDCRLARQTICHNCYNKLGPGEA